MPAKTIDKVIIANRSAMSGKYGAGGLAAIDAALGRLIAADAVRGLATLVVEIDDAAQMAGHGGNSVINVNDQRGAKDAVDAIDQSLGPDYIMLLDGPDIIPHVTLDAIPGLVDPDRDIPSDLPYACSAPFSLDAKAYVAVTRVVGRLPMAAGAADAAPFAALIDRCATHQPQQAAAFASFFAISADVWKQSTQLSLSAVFRKHSGMHTAPTATHAGIDTGLASLAHFINCHGATADNQFYGERAGKFSVAMIGPQVAPHIRPGTIAAVECCYGAELYNPSLLGIGQPICMSYMHGGATAYVGSTNIAYGPAAANGQADLITQFFLQDVLKGASTGRAMLQARQRFVGTQAMSTQTNLKTLAQFVLYGDPSLVPVEVAPVPGKTAVLASESAEATAKNDASGRKSRRVLLTGNGLAVAAAATLPGRSASADPAVLDRVQALAKARGYSAKPAVFAVTGGAQFRFAAKSLDRQETVAIICEPTIDRAMPGTGKTIPFNRVLIARILGNGIVAVEECESR